MHLVQSMAYVGEAPWHSLGRRLIPNQSLEVWAQQAGMDWRIETAVFISLPAIHSPVHSTGILIRRCCFDRIPKHRCQSCRVVSR